MYKSIQQFGKYELLKDFNIKIFSKSMTLSDLDVMG